jgi:hypothetical protein
MRIFELRADYFSGAHLENGSEDWTWEVELGPFEEAERVGVLAVEVLCNPFEHAPVVRLV